MNDTTTLYNDTATSTPTTKHASFSMPASSGNLKFRFYHTGGSLSQDIQLYLDNIVITTDSDNDLYSTLPVGRVVGGSTVKMG